MLTWMRRSSATGQRAAKLYGSAVAQARSPAFYEGCGVPDTIEGRFELIVLHLFIVLERLRAEGEEGRQLGQALLEAFVSDMDDSMRELGIGDLSVPRRIKKTAAAVAERVEDYRSAVAGQDRQALVEALGRHVSLQPAGAVRLAGYVRAILQTLASAGGARILAGEIEFPSV